jgi:hypothetical protein
MFALKFLENISYISGDVSLLMFAYVYPYVHTFHDPYVCANIRVWTPTDVKKFNIIIICILLLLLLLLSATYNYYKKHKCGEKLRNTF